jgi:hypothetical protein
LIRRIKQFFKAVKHQRQIRALVSSQLSILESGSAFALGGLTEDEEEGVRALVGSCKAPLAGEPSCVVEFGTLFGITTALLAQHKPAGMKVITVDNFCWNPFGLTPAMHRDFTYRILRSQVARRDIHLAETDSKTFRDTYEGGAPAMVFFDADHSYEAVRDEIAWAKEIGVPLISGHDYGNPKFGVTKAVDEAFPCGIRVRGTVWWWRGD